MPPKSTFTQEQQDFIYQNYTSMTNLEIGEIIGKTAKQVKGFADNRGLRKGTKPVSFTDTQKEYIFQWYNKKENGQIAKELGLTTKQVNDFAYRKGLKRDVEKYIVDENYFEKIDTQEKAYWLGFLYADGCVTENKRNGKNKGYTLEITLAQKDEIQLIHLKRAINSNVPIKTKKVKQFSAVKLAVSNSKLCRDLIQLGCTPRKSLTLTFPFDKMDSSLYSHFIRGYFDGDGCVYSKSEKYIHSVSFVGTNEFLTDIQNIVNKELGLTKTKLQQKGNAFQCAWSGRNNLLKWYSYLYNTTNCMCLDRKKDIFVRGKSIA